jgi:dihydroorotate dehydrogenase
MDYYKLIKPFLYKLSPESAHNLAILALKNGLLPTLQVKSYPSLKTKLFDIEFDNPVGLAAGFDKNADGINCLIKQGFGFIEVGTVTPRPQTGNAKPRLFRLEEDEAVINRFGFNNKGAEYFVKNLKSKKAIGIVGANIGKNKNSEDAVADYIYLLDKVYNFSDYITINISSPNTPGLRDLQNKDELDAFLAALLRRREELVKQHGKRVPMLLKLAPDTSKKQREEIADVVIKRRIDGLIISNTTVGRGDLKSVYAAESGGLSGRPLFAASTQMVRDMFQLTAGKMPIIGVGGVFSADDAYAKIRAGASLVQVYSALVYKGFGLVEEIKSGLDVNLKKDGFKHIYDAVGVDNSNFS